MTTAFDSHPAADVSEPIERRVAALDWPSLCTALDNDGCAVTGALLDEAECAALIDAYEAEAGFRRLRKVLYQRIDTNRRVVLD